MIGFPFASLIITAVDVPKSPDGLVAKNNQYLKSPEPAFAPKLIVPAAMNG